MEDALLSPTSFMILSGAGLMDASTETPIYTHVSEITDNVQVSGDTVTITLKTAPWVGSEFGSGNSEITLDLNGEHFIYVMRYDGTEVVTEPYLPTKANQTTVEGSGDTIYTISFPVDAAHINSYIGDSETSVFSTGCTVLVDYYTRQTSNVQQIDITADKFGGNYYLEASTLFRDTNGVDLPAEFIIPNCKVQSNFTFTMASTGDPSTFSFVLDAFPDYTRFNKTQKVLAAIQVINTAASEGAMINRTKTYHDTTHEQYFID